VLKQLKLLPAVAAIVLAQPAPAVAQLGSNCTASIQNRTVPVNANGTFAIPNVPVDDGFYRVRVVCEQPDGSVRGGQSDFLVLVANGDTVVQRIEPGVVEPGPVAVRVTALKVILSGRGETVQLAVTGALTDGSIRDLTARALGTTYSTSNGRVATVSEEGLVTAAGRGRAVVTARNEGAAATIAIDVLVPDDTDGDGMPDAFERAWRLDPLDAGDAGVDADGDGLPNLTEFQRGTSPLAADTDGDGLADGDELLRGGDPARADSDGDLLPDGREVQLGTNLTDPDTDADGVPDGIEVQLGRSPLAAEAGTVVQGVIVDDGGSPVPDATAIVLERFSAAADPSGFFRISGVPATVGPITVLARAVVGGRLLDGSSLPVAPLAGGVSDAGTIRIRLNSGVVSGRVLDPRDAPVSGALVTVAAGADRRTAATDATGFYRVTNVPAGPFSATARDPRSGLRGRATGSLAQNQSASLDVRLSPSGSVVGAVLERDRVSRTGAGDSVLLTNGVAQTRTDALGQYAFEFAPLGGFAVDAADAAGNRGRASGVLSSTGRVARADVTYLGQGTVRGTVRNAAGEPVGAARVTLASASVFGGGATTLSGADGGYEIAGVFIGPVEVTAVATASGTAGRAAGAVSAEGEIVTLDVALGPSGSITGTVRGAGGVTPIGGARVSLTPSSLTVIASAQGVYRLDGVPARDYRIDATDPLTGDKGQTTATLSSQGQTVTADITMNGQGAVIVEVRDGADQSVAGAAVVIDTTSPLAGRQSGTTLGDGRARFDGVLAGTFTARATQAGTLLAGAASGSVGVGQITSLVVRLSAAGSVLGRVLQPDGATPVPRVGVGLVGGGGVRRGASDADGAFRFADVPTGTYRLEAFDGFGTRRAVSPQFSISSHGQEVGRDLTYVGAGTVRGRITRPDGTAAANAGVLIAVEGFSNRLSALSAVDGTYRIDGVPVGRFTVTASLAAPGSPALFGSERGEMIVHEGEVAVDVALFGTLFDASNYAFNLGPSGAAESGALQVFDGDLRDNRGATTLDLRREGVTHRFRGESFQTEEDGREVVLRQSGVAGLDVTRKVMVPRDGYFARYVEILDNPTVGPIVVDVRVGAHYRFFQEVVGLTRFSREPRIVDTSSGDTALELTQPEGGDRWFVLDDNRDVDPFQVASMPAVASVFEGQGADLPANGAEFTLSFAPEFGRSTVEWTAVAVPPGGRVVLLHFLSQQTSRAAARASAERLALLPPEGLAGLEADELEAIRNFAVPAGGASAVPALPPLAGAVSGRVLASDGATAVPGAPVSWRSLHPLFGRTFFREAGVDAGFSIQGAFDNVGRSVAVPVFDFVLGATHPETGVEAPATPGAFAEDASAAVLDVVFTIGGVVTGTVRRSEDDAVVSSGRVEASGGRLLRTLSSPIAPDGSYRFNALPGSPDPYTLAAVLPHPQGTALTGATSVVVNDGGVHAADLFIEATGGLSGTVLQSGGEIAVDLPVRLEAGGFSRLARTDTGGRFSLPDLPERAYTLSAFDATANAAAAVELAITAGEEAVRDLVLASSGAVEGQVSAPDGSPASGARVSVAAAGEAFEATAGADGRYRVEGVPPGLVVAVALDAATGLRGRSAARLDTAGRTLTLNVSLFALGSVRGQALRVDGVTPAAGAQMSIDRFLAGLPTNLVTGADGTFEFDFVPIGAFTIDAADGATGERGRGVGFVSAAGDLLEVPVILTGVGVVRVTVRDGAGLPVPGAEVTLTSLSVFGGVRAGVADSGGVVEFEAVPAAGFSIAASDPVTRLQATTLDSVAPGGVTLVTLSLQPAATITGRVLSSSGSRVIPAAIVRLLGAGQIEIRRVTAGADGGFRFEGVSLGALTLDATDPATGDRGLLGVSLGAHGEQRAVDLRLNGLGGVVVTVLDASGAPLPGATVRLTGQTPLGGVHTRTSAADGTATFEAAFAGAFEVLATVPVSGLTGSATGVAIDGATVPIEVRIEGGASVAGTVFSPDGVTPAPGVNLRLSSSTLTRSAVGAADGTFRFDGVSFASYTLDALSSFGRLRAREFQVQPSPEQPVAMRNLRLAAMGTVRGRVLNPDATPAPGLVVSLASSHPLAAGTAFMATTDADGRYEILEVHAGSFNVFALDPARDLRGAATGTLTQDGESVTADIQLVSSAVNLPLEVRDANRFPYRVTGDGRIENSNENAFSGGSGATRGAFRIELEVEGTPAPFPSEPLGTSEEGGREIVLDRADVGGLEVTRKIYVPRWGYFARYLEIVRNPAPVPVTIDLRIGSALRARVGVLSVGATSTGDEVFDVADPVDPDRWLVIDDAGEFDPPDERPAGDEDLRNTPPVSFVFDGPGAAARADTAAWVPAGQTGDLVYGWGGVTVPAEGTVAFLHFGVQQLNRAAALAAAERLVQLPPEALEGLSPEERAAVRNFVVPPGGVSALAPLPRLDGRVSGRALAVDGAAPIPPADLTFKSDHVLFGRTVRSFFTGEDGQFAVVGDVLRSGDLVAVPAYGFTVSATHFDTRAVAMNHGEFPAPGSFTGNLARAFGMASASTEPIFREPVLAIDGDINSTWQTPVSNQGVGEFLEIALPAPSEVTHVNLRGNTFRQCCDVRRARLDIFDAQRQLLHTEEFDLPPPPSDVALDIPDQSNVGSVRLTLLEVGFEFGSPEGFAEVEILGTADITAFAGTTADIVFSDTGMFRGTVRRHTGNPVADAEVRAVRSQPSTVSTLERTADDGTYVLTALPAGSYEITASASHPQGSAVTGRLSAEAVSGEVTIADITLDPTGSVSGTVRTALGIPAFGIGVTLLAPPFSRFTTTDFSGRFLLMDVPAGTYLLRAVEPNSQVPTEVAIAVAQDQATVQDLTLVGFGTVTVQVNRADGTLGTNVLISRSSATGGFVTAGRTGSDGRLEIVGVPVGPFVIRAHHPLNEAAVFVDAGGTMPAQDANVALLITLPRVGTVTGRVRFPNGADAPGAGVTLLRPGLPDLQTSADAGGVYRFLSVGLTNPFRLRAFSPLDYQQPPRAFRETGGFNATTEGSTFGIDLSVPASATLQIRVIRSTGAPIPNVEVRLDDAFSSAFVSVGLTGADGFLHVANVPEGAFVVASVDPNTGNISHTATGQIFSFQHLQTISVGIVVSFSGTVQGTLTAGDGQTPISGAFTELLDPLTGERRSSAFTDSAGTFRFSASQPGYEGLRLVAHSPLNFNDTAEQRVVLTSQGQVVNVPLTLPLGVVSGTVYFSDGVTPVPFPSIFLVQTLTGGGVTSIPARQSDAGGRYVVIGARTGDFTLIAIDTASGLRSEIAGRLEDIAVAVILDAILPPSGTATGVVSDAGGAPLTGADVALTSGPLGLIRFGTTDTTGRYRFDRVALGSFGVQARGCGAGCITISGSGSLSADGETANVDLTLPATGTVLGTVFAPDGSTPVGGAPVSVENGTHPGPLGISRLDVLADAAGEYVAAGVPEGSIRVIASHPVDATLGGVAEGALVAGSSAIIDVTLTNVRRFPVILQGADGFVYDVECEGYLCDGGSADGSLSDAYDGAYFLTVGGQHFPCVRWALPEDGGREVALGPDSVAGLRVERKVFVPESGRFARYLEILANPSSSTVSVSVVVDGNLGSDGATRLVVAPAATGNTYAVSDQQGLCCDPVLAHVFGGPGAPLTASEISFTGDNLLYRWEVTIPAGGRVALMHFAVQRGSDQAEAALQQAEALVRLEDPEALSGLSAEERSWVINFEVP
jgi:hypothetical protein